MPDIINKKQVTLDQAIDSKSLKKKSTKELERMLDTLLTTDHDNDATVNTIIAEIIKRGEKVSNIPDELQKVKQKVEKAFRDLSCIILEKGKKKKVDLGEMIDEHEKLVKILESKSHKDDEKEAKKQKKELNEYKEETNK